MWPILLLGTGVAGLAAYLMRPAKNAGVPSPQGPTPLPPTNPALTYVPREQWTNGATLLVRINGVGLDLDWTQAPPGITPATMAPFLAAFRAWVTSYPSSKLTRLTNCIQHDIDAVGNMTVDNEFPKEVLALFPAVLSEGGVPPTSFRVSFPYQYVMKVEAPNAPTMGLANNLPTTGYVYCKDIDSYQGAPEESMALEATLMAGISANGPDATVMVHDISPMPGNGSMATGTIPAVPIQVIPGITLPAVPMWRVQFPILSVKPNW